MAAASSAVARPASTDIVISRVLKAPPELVFAAFTDADHIANWWGPRGFTTTTESMDVRPGGVWRHTMRGPDGTEYPNVTEYLEVDPPRRLVYAVSSGEPDDPGSFVSTLTFDPESGGTRLTMRMTFASPEVRDEVIRKVGAVQGGLQTFDRLEEHIASLAAPEADRHQVIFTRMFAAPRSLVWKAFTEPEHLQQWWCPADWTLPVCEVDLRPGGAWLYYMKGPDGTEAWGRATYREIDEPARLAYTDSFVDAQGNLLPDLPQSSVVVEFSEVEDGTIVTFRTSLASAAEREQLIAMGMVEGLGMSLDKLEAHLASLA